MSYIYITEAHKVICKEQEVSIPVDLTMGMCASCRKAWAPHCPTVTPYLRHQQHMFLAARVPFATIPLKSVPVREMAKPKICSTTVSLDQPVLPALLSSWSYCLSDLLLTRSASPSLSRFIIRGQNTRHTEASSLEPLTVKAVLLEIPNTCSSFSFSCSWSQNLVVGYGQFLKEISFCEARELWKGSKFILWHAENSLTSTFDPGSKVKEWSCSYKIMRLNTIPYVLKWKKKRLSLRTKTVNF